MLYTLNISLQFREIKLKHNLVKIKKKSLKIQNLIAMNSYCQTRNNSNHYKYLIENYYKLKDSSSCCSLDMKTYGKDHARVLASVAKEYTPFVELKDEISKHDFFFHIELLLTRKHFNTDLLYFFIDVHSHQKNTTYFLIRGQLN